jgi:hypothetical protein
MPRFSGGTEPEGGERILPSSSIEPEVGSMKPAIIRSVVVLPQPEGPEQRNEFPGLDMQVEIENRIDRTETATEFPEDKSVH